MSFTSNKSNESKTYKEERKSEQINEAIRRLCHFVPTEEKENMPALLHEFLVKHAMIELGTEPHSLLDIKGSLSRLFNLDFEKEEIEGAIERLKGKKSVISSLQDVYSLDIRTYSELKKSLKDSEDFEQRIIDQWLEEIERKYSGLDQDDLKLLEEDLWIYLTKIFARHGAECATLIYAGQEEAKRFIAELKDDIFTFLPGRSPGLHKIRIIELPNFFKNASAERKRYIAQFLDSTFIIHMLHIDKNCSALIQKQFKDYRLYLDTNFVYRLLGLQGSVLQKAAERAVKLAQRLNFILIVSTRTIGEWDDSIKWATKRLKEHPLPRSFAKIGAEYTTEEDFTTAYWHEYTKSGISIDDFFAIYQRIEDLLKEYNIKISNALCDRIKKDPELQKETDKVNWASFHYKSEKVAEHDAFHRLLILRLRGKTPPKRFSDAKVWFLTCDTSLSVYDRSARKGSTGVPFCILSNQWIQIMRPLLPRTLDFDKTFADLLISPYFKTYGHLPSDVTQKILGRVAQFKYHSPELAVKILTDRHLTEQLNQTEGEGKAIELIDNATAKAAEEFREERDRLKKQLEKTKKEKEDIERDKSRLERKFRWIPTYFIWIAIGVIALFVPWVNLHSWEKSLVIGGLVVGGIAVLSFPFGKSKTWKIICGVAVLCSILSFIWSFIKK